ncbi:MAG TPA: FAD-binding and (Fe-S)-binding domain-containing protein [Candidatus Rubrimentiphilum sp.]|nr:FAD-binding and (Fe-S)-binding domain-containing protein [Candidatus Rubrimentiphilum sp.]
MSEGLEHDLKAAVRGEVRFDDGYRAMYSTDASNYRQIPLAVVCPKDEDDVVSAVAACRKHGAPIVNRGGGTSLAGETCNNAVVLDFSKYMNRVLEIDYDERYAWVQPGCVLDDLRNLAEKKHLTFGPDPSTHNRNTIGGMIGNNSCGMHAQMAGRTEQNILELEILTYDGLRLVVGKGDAAIVLASSFDDAVAQRATATQDDTVRAPVSEIRSRLKALGDKYAGLIRERFPDIPRRVSGFALNELLPENDFNVARALVGTEGTCVTVLRAKCKLVHSPPFKSLAMLGFEDIASAGDFVPFCNRHEPIALEAVDETLFNFMREKGLVPHDKDELFPAGSAWLIVQFGEDTQEAATAKAEALVADARSPHARLDSALTALRSTALRLGRQTAPAQDDTSNDAPHDASTAQRDTHKPAPHIKGAKVIADEHMMQEIWEIREAGLGVTSKIPGEGDFYPGWEDSAVDPQYLGDYLREFAQVMKKYGYSAALYGHFGQACVHCSINFDLFTAEGIKKYRKFVTEMAHICVKYHGSLSGEHGDGQARGELLPIMYGDELVDAFWQFKQIWDPQNKMNPGKVVHPRKLDEDLRWGVNYEPWEPKTHFSFHEDRNSFAYAANRCVGAGVCRRHDKGTMCPSYMATREEMHSTRGRTRLLFEMLQGDPMKGRWQNETVKEALDLCLGCKGCKGECPVNVDMATYKAEFLSHYFEGKPRPLFMYAFGLMFWWAEVASRMPGVVNFFSQAFPFSAIIKRMLSIAPEREIPMFAARTFRQGLKRAPLGTHASGALLGVLRQAQDDTLKPAHHDTLKPAQDDTLKRAPLGTHASGALLGVLRQAQDDTLKPAHHDTLKPAHHDTLKPAHHDTLKPAHDDTGNTVILWADTWNNYFHPQTLEAAVEVLEDAGFDVVLPPRQICCGRPLYDYGMLERARKQLLPIIDDLRPLIRAGVPLLMLEPSCASVFKDEMLNLFPNDRDARRLAEQTFLFESFMDEKCKDYKPPKLKRKAVVHEHCHKKATLNRNAETHIFDRMELDYENLESGCCGMAGGFGFEEAHYDVSVKCGERVLLPKVREALPETVVVADGFSCREQIAQLTQRQALHPSQVMQMALQATRERRESNDPFPELRYLPDIRKEREEVIRRGYTVLGAIAAGAALAAIGALVLWRRK